MCSEGSTSTSTSVDKWYNKYVAAPLQLKNQAMADTLFDTYQYGVGTYSYEDIAPILNKKGVDKSGYYDENGELTKKGLKAQSEHGWEINPETGKLSKKTYVDDPNNIGQMQLEQMQTTANAELLPMQTALEKLSLEQQTEATKQSGLARNKLFDLTMAGTDPRGAMNRAQADVEQAAGLASKSATNQAFRAGVDPNSGQYANLQKQLLLNKSKGIAGARTTARVSEEDKNYERLAGLSAYGL